MPGSVFRLLYRVYASIAALLVIFVLFCPLIILAPTLALRREIGRLCVRATLAVMFVPFRVRGLEHLPKTPCVAIANHSSYLDGLIFTAALPRRFSFVVQDGAADWPYVGLVIKRMGVRFIKRNSARDSALQMRGLIRELRQKLSLAIFPEGTFHEEPGLLPFYKGAFSMASKAGVPVVPAVIRGTRRLFSDNSRMISWSHVEVEFMPPLQAADERPESAVALRDQARSLILARAGEPDRANA